ncbi:MAG: zinc ribbon domain-containing protein [Xenococcaceae cyanobacterium MO_167.B27]|nr:zinc ribbon domain-containing protein [Xenococcaceae cyanobacterium MO_167.B27]
MCSNCGTHTGKKELNVRVHQCPECGFEQDRDVVAAQVVKKRGLETLLCGRCARLNKKLLESVCRGSNPR